jgi:hypothetical protein
MLKVVKEMEHNIYIKPKDYDDEGAFPYCEFCAYFEECDLTEEDFEEAGADQCPYFEPMEDCMEESA